MSDWWKNFDEEAEEEDYWTEDDIEMERGEQMRQYEIGMELERKANAWDDLDVVFVDETPPEDGEIDLSDIVKEEEYEV